MLFFSLPKQINLPENIIETSALGASNLAPRPIAWCSHLANLMTEPLSVYSEILIVIAITVFHNRINRLECRGNYSATLNDMKLSHWPLIGGLLHLVQRGGDWAGPQPTGGCSGPVGRVSDS